MQNQGVIPGLVLGYRRAYGYFAENPLAALRVITGSYLMDIDPPVSLINRFPYEMIGLIPAVIRQEFGDSGEEDLI